MENTTPDIRRGYPQTQPVKPVIEIPEIRYRNGEATVIGEELHRALGLNGRYPAWFRDLTIRYGFQPGKDYEVTTAQNGKQTHWIGAGMVRTLLQDIAYCRAEPILALLDTVEEKTIPETPETLLRKVFRMIETEVKNWREETDRTLHRIREIEAEMKDRADGMVEVLIPGPFVARVRGNENGSDEPAKEDEKHE